MNQSLIGCSFSFENNISRQKQWLEENNADTSFKIYYDNNENITSFLKTTKSELVRFAFNWPGLESSEYGHPVIEETRNDYPQTFPDRTVHNTMLETIENILFEVFGKWYHAEFGELEEIELLEFRREIDSE